MVEWERGLDLVGGVERSRIRWASRLYPAQGKTPESRRTSTIVSARTDPLGVQQMVATHTQYTLHTHTHTHSYTYTHTHTCVHPHTHTRTHARTHTHTRICTRTHTHTCPDSACMGVVPPFLELPTSQEIKGTETCGLAMTGLVLL